MTPSEVPDAMWARFVTKFVVDEVTGCWVWTAFKNKKGYGMFGVAASRPALAHRVSYVRHYGPIPKGLQIDHVKARGCRTTSCVNPTHLEIVTSQTNTLRGDTLPAKWAARTHCAEGHALTPDNVYASRGRQCRRCTIDRATRRRANARR